MPDLLPAGLALSSLLGFGLGAVPFRSGSGSARDSLVDYLYPMTVAFFVGYLAMTLLPHALEEAGTSLPAFAAGIGTMYFLTRKVFHRDPCCEAGHQPDPLGWTAFLALSICAVNDGILIGLANPYWLSGLSLGMLLHKVTSSFALALVLSRWRHRGRALIWMGIGHAAISPAFFYLGDFLRAAEAFLDPLLGFSAGILAHTVLKGMLPHSGQMLKRKPAAWVGFLGALGGSMYLGYVHRAFH